MTRSPGGAFVIRQETRQHLAPWVFALLVDGESATFGSSALLSRTGYSYGYRPDRDGA